MTDTITPAAAVALEALKKRRLPPRLAAHNWSDHDEHGWTVTLVRADGKRSWITRPTLAEALVRAAEYADELAADVRTVARV